MGSLATTAFESRAGLGTIGGPVASIMTSLTAGPGRRTLRKGDGDTLIDDDADGAAAEAGSGPDVFDGGPVSAGAWSVVRYGVAAVPAAQ